MDKTIRKLNADIDIKVPIGNMIVLTMRLPHRDGAMATIHTAAMKCISYHPAKAGFRLAIKGIA